MLDDVPEGYYLPFHRSMTRPILLKGVPRRLAILNGTWTLAFGLGGQVWWVIPVGILFHVLASLGAKWDPWFFDVLLEHIKTKAYYHV
jgi:type IV secretion system protein TrbD